MSHEDAQGVDRHLAEYLATRRRGRLAYIGAAVFLVALVVDAIAGMSIARTYGWVAAAVSFAGIAAVLWTVYGWFVENLLIMRGK